MKRPPPLRLEPRTSRLGRLLVVAGGAITAALVAWLPLDPLFEILALAVIAHATARGVRQCAGRGVPALLLVGTDRRIVVRFGGAGSSASLRAADSGMRPRGGPACLPWSVGTSRLPSHQPAPARGSGCRSAAGEGGPLLSAAFGTADGCSCDGTILDATYVGARLVTIVWRADADRAGWRRLRPARTIVVLPDTLPADDFRRLRVVLRYGRVASTERGTRGAIAG